VHSNPSSDNITVEEFKDSPGKKRRSRDMDEVTIIKSVSSVRIATVGAAYYAEDSKPGEIADAIEKSSPPENKGW